MVLAVHELTLLDYSNKNYNHGRLCLYNWHYLIFKGYVRCLVDFIEDIVMCELNNI